MIICDTREQKNQHILKYFDEHNIEYKIAKLDEGDYKLVSNDSLVVDRKQNLQEVAQNVCQGHDRFVRECLRCIDKGEKLVVLIEEEKIGCLADVPKWYNFRRRFSPRAITGKRLWKIMSTMRDEYKIDWEFAKREDFPKRLLEILGGDEMGCGGKKKGGKKKGK